MPIRPITSLKNTDTMLIKLKYQFSQHNRANTAFNTRDNHHFQILPLSRSSIPKASIPAIYIYIYIYGDDVDGIKTQTMRFSS